MEQVVPMGTYGSSEVMAVLLALVNLQRNLFSFVYFYSSFNFSSKDYYCNVSYNNEWNKHEVGLVIKYCIHRKDTEIGCRVANPIYSGELVKERVFIPFWASSYYCVGNTVQHLLKSSSKHL